MTKEDRLRNEEKQKIRVYESGKLTVVITSAKGRVRSRGKKTRTIQSGTPSKKRQEARDLTEIGEKVGEKEERRWVRSNKKLAVGSKHRVSFGMDAKDGGGWDTKNSDRVFLLLACE